jgi:Ca2+-transporting ATPase
MSALRHETPPPVGLTSAQAAERLREFGPNSLPEDGEHGFLTLLKEILTEPMLLLLVVAATLYLVLGDLGEGLMLAFFAFVTIGLVVYQRRRSENALEALRALAAPDARVVRDGETITVPASTIVPGDVILVEEGERIPADAVLYRSSQLVVDESLLTGESVPVRKRPAKGTEAEAEPGGDDKPFVWSGTLALRGHGRAAVTATGHRTRAGAIGASLSSIVSEKTRLELSVGRIVRIFGAVGLLVSVALMLWIGLVLGDWMKGALSAIALAMAMLPEEFPVVLSVFLALGAWRLAQVKVLARRPAVVEMLGAADVLCVDKTGTITENRMRVRALDTLSDRLDVSPETTHLPRDFRQLAEAAWLATRHVSQDPMDRAVSDLAHLPDDGIDLHAEWPLEREYALTPDLLATSYAWRRSDGKLAVATKGAPEAVISLCHVKPAAAKRIDERVHALARRGLRVLAVGVGTTVRKALPDNVHDLKFHFAGLIGFEEPVRTTVPAAVAEARRAGMSVKMITGDYPETARAIASEAGITTIDGVATGRELAALDDEAYAERAMAADVFARMMPEQKLRLVQALKARGRVVAMTGDGVNDAPALKAAHIGIAIGHGGTDVAREASGIVLLDEDFGRLVAAVRMGRRIFDNLRKAMIYIAAIHVPIAGLALIPLLFGLPPLLFPAHVVLTEMVIDPMSSIAFETTPEEKDIMDRPPRPLAEPIAGLPQIVLGLLQGAALLAAALAAYWLPMQWGYPVEAARTFAFVALTAGNVGLVRLNDTRRLLIVDVLSRGHAVFWALTLITAGVTSACIMEPHLRELFGFAAVQPLELSCAIAAGLGAVMVADLTKLVPAVRRIMGAA